MSATGFSESVIGGCWAASIFVDAITGASVVDPLAVTSIDLQLRPNRSGVYAIFDAPGFQRPDYPIQSGSYGVAAREKL